MKHVGLTLMVAALLFSCADDNKSTGVLAEAPYRPLTDSLQQQPDNAGLYYRRGSLLYSNDQKALAQADLKQAWQLQPTEAHALSVVTVLVEQNADSAIRFINEALQTLPGSVSLQMALARGYQQKGDVKSAIQTCNNILAQYPNSLDALLLQAELLKGEGREAEALATLEKAYSYAPFDAPLAYNLAFEYAEAKNRKALALCDSLIRMDQSGKHAEPYYIKGVYYQNIGQPAQALKLYDEAIRHDYNFLDAYMDKGRLQYQQGQYAEALKTFTLPVTITPTYADGYYWIGRCQEALNQKADAKGNYQRAYSLDKTLTEAKAAADKL